MIGFWRRVRCIAEACLKKEGLAFIALMVSLFGTGILTALYAINLEFLRANGKTDEIFYLNCGQLVLISFVFMSCHRLLGAKQAIEIEFWKLKAKMSQGDDDADA